MIGYENTSAHGVAIVRRFTITLSEQCHRALKESSTERSKSISQLIEESLEFFGVKTRAQASQLVKHARTHSGMNDDAAQALANREVRAVRQRGRRVEVIFKRRHVGV